MHGKEKIAFQMYSLLKTFLSQAKKSKDAETPAPSALVLPVDDSLASESPATSRPASSRTILTEAPDDLEENPEVEETPVEEMDDIPQEDMEDAPVEDMDDPPPEEEEAPMEDMDDAPMEDMEDTPEENADDIVDDME